MSSFKTIFSRYEKKYIITKDDMERLLEAIGNRFTPDEFGESLVCNIYFDTPDYRLIRASIEKSAFKEKIRIRSYGIPTPDSRAFVEIKRKYKGVVYKRRVGMTYNEAVDLLCRNKRIERDSQIMREVEYFKSFYGIMMPAVSMFYDRTAYFSKEDSSLRLTFDSNIRYRTQKLDLMFGDSGTPIADGSQIVMELKSEKPFPLWLCEALCELKIYPSPFSKYGIAYGQIAKEKTKKQSATA